VIGTPEMEDEPKHEKSRGLQIYTFTDTKKAQNKYYAYKA